MSRPACSAGGESWRRCASWAEFIAGNTKRIAERVSASRNRDSLSFTSIACSILSLGDSRIAVDRRKRTDPRIFHKGYASSERTQRQRSRTRLRCLDESQNYCFVPISHLSGQNGTYDPKPWLRVLNLTRGTFCLGAGRPGSTHPSSRYHLRLPGKIRTL